jgi:hypothetical protein
MPLATRNAQLAVFCFVNCNTTTRRRTNGPDSKQTIQNPQEIRFWTEEIFRQETLETDCQESGCCTGQWKKILA